MQIRTVLCPIDFSTLDPAEVDMAIEVCRTFGARLVVHHNFAAAEPGFSRAWEWEKAHQPTSRAQPEAERRLRSVVERAKRDVAAEGLMTVGPVGPVVLALAEDLRADLLVLGSHGWSTQDHASVTERVVRESPCPVLTFQERVDRPGFRLRREREQDPPWRVVLPTDLTSASAAAVAYGFALARKLPLQLDLLHVIDPGHLERQRQQAARDALEALVPPDLAGTVATHVRGGPAAAGIVEHVAAVQPMFTILGEHAHGLVRRLLTRDTTCQVMHRVECPVWVVPSRWPA